MATDSGTATMGGVPGVQSERAVETMALTAGTAAFVVGAVAALVAFRFEPAPIAGPGSIGQFSAIVSAVVALICVFAGRYLLNRGAAHRRLRLVDHLDIAALAIAHAVTALLGWTLLSVLLAEAFLDAVVFPIPVLILGGVSAAVTAYITFSSAIHMNRRLLALLFAAFFVTGVLTSMLTASDPDWWKDNLSALGMTSNVSARAFNLTLIVSGFLVTTLARYATRDVPAGDARGVVRVRRCLALIGVFLALVGVFPVDQFWAIHVGVSIGMLAAFGVLVILLPRWVPGLPRPFIVLGWLFLAITVLLGVFYAVGHYTLTAVELVGGALVFTWVILLIRNTDALWHDAPRGVPAA